MKIRLGHPRQSLCCLETKNGFMASLPDTRHIFRERNIYLRNLELRSWLRPRAVSRLRTCFARNKIIKVAMLSELTSPGYVDPQGCNQYDHKECWFVKTHHCTSNEVPVHATYPVFLLSDFKQ